MLAYLSQAAHDWAADAYLWSLSFDLGREAPLVAHGAAYSPSLRRLRRWHYPDPRLGVRRQLEHDWPPDQPPPRALPVDRRLRPLGEVLAEAQRAAGPRGIDGLVLWPEGEWEARVEEWTYRPIRVPAFEASRQRQPRGVRGLLSRLRGRSENEG